MSKSSGTRSGLLWEVERLLNEIDNLPQVLLMENVSQIHSEKNMPDFQKWIDFLSRKGYSNYWQDLNAKDYGVAQNRDRTFMVSVLGEYNYKFPQPIPLTKIMKDYLEDEVDERYYVNTENAQKMIESLIENGNINYCAGNINPSGKGINGNVYGGELSPTITTNKGEGTKIVTTCKLDKMPDEHLASLDNAKICDVATETASTITTRYYKGICAHNDNMVIEKEVKQIGNIANNGSCDNPKAGRIYASDGLCPTINTCQGGQREPKTIVAMRGRNPNNPSDCTAGSPTEQRLEPNTQGLCNTLTNVQKDNLVLENVPISYGMKLEPKTIDIGMCITSRYHKGFSNYNPENAVLREDNCVYKIRKLTPFECWRLMGFADEDFLSAKLGSQEVSKEMLKTYPHLGKRAFTEVQRLEKTSNTQLYKQAGNSIVKNVLVAIFGQMVPGKENIYKQI